MMVKKQIQTNPNVERVFAQFIADVEAHANVPKEAAERLKEHLSSGRKIDPESIDNIING